MREMVDRIERKNREWTKAEFEPSKHRIADNDELGCIVNKSICVSNLFYYISKWLRMATAKPEEKLSVFFHSSLPPSPGFFSNFPNGSSLQPLEFSTKSNVYNL